MQEAAWIECTGVVQYIKYKQETLNKWPECREPMREKWRICNLFLREQLRENEKVKQGAFLTRAEKSKILNRKRHFGTCKGFTRSFVVG